jgi:hypothetical protein
METVYKNPILQSVLKYIRSLKKKQYNISLVLNDSFYSTTHIYLAAITTMDTLTIIFPSIIYFHIFVILDIDDYLPYNLCRVWYYFTDIFPVTFHAAAILLTVCSINMTHGINSKKATRTIKCDI